MICWGLGAMGQEMVKLVLGRPNLKLIGAIDTDPSKVGKDIGALLGWEQHTGITVSQRPEDVLLQEAQVVLVATGSFLEQVGPQLQLALDMGKNVITIAEEMAYPWIDHRPLAEGLDQLAWRKGVSLLGTGVNPGFVLDTLILLLTGVCQDVQEIWARRVNDLSAFGPTVLATQGVGTSPRQFVQGVAEGTIVGHVGFRQSIALLADALGWELDEIREEREPIIATVPREATGLEVEPGMVAGCNHRAYAVMGAQVVITMEHPQQIQPHREQVATGDFIKIVGRPEINLEIKPEIPGGVATASLAVNMIPQVVAAPPGLLTMKDLPVPRLHSHRHSKEV